MTDIKIPTYDGTESVNLYMKRVEKYKFLVLKEKYDTILNFINELQNTKYKSLGEFKNIKESNLLKNANHNNEILKKYITPFKTKLSVEINAKENESNSKYIFFLMTKVLLCIEYKLVKKAQSNEVFYTIVQK